MSTRLGAFVLVMAVGSASCGYVGMGRPFWCGQEDGPGLEPPSGQTSPPAPTIDESRLVCIAVTNRSEIEMGMNTIVEGGSGSDWGRIEACGGVMASNVTTAENWRIDVGPSIAGGGDISSIVESFDSAELEGGGPYLLDVTIDSAGAVTIEQRDSLPSDTVSARHC